MRSTLRRLGISAVMTATLVAAAGLPARAEVTTGTISGQITSASSGWVNVYNTSYTWTTGTNINADGSYSVQVPAGAYKLEISVDGLSQWAYQKTDFSQADTFTVTAGSVLTVNETLLPTGSLVGTLLDGATPVAGVSVSAQPADGHRPSSAFTDQQGRFVMRLLPGQYRIAFYPDSGLVQYYRQQVDINLAELVTITDGESTEITEMVRPSGSASGRLTEDGVGVAGAQVFWRQGEFVTVSAMTDGDGHYRLPRLFAGEYTVMFWLPDQRSQWAHGKISEESADRFTVVAGAETVVDETVLPTGQVRVHAVDAKTGQALTGFCADISGRFSCTDDQVITFEKVPVGRHKVIISPSGDGYLYGASGFVDVTANGIADVTVAVDPAGIITTVVRDRRSGQPVPGVCLHAAKLRLASFAGGPRSCSDEQGRVRLGHLTPDTYTLFALVDDGVHGMQWVGPNGGTGSQFEARQVTVDGGQTVDVPHVLLDAAGSISGRVTDKSTGKPVQQAVVSLLTVHPNFGFAAPAAETDADGRYTFANLGPYDWPLHFGHAEYAGHWSGGVPSRLLAETVKVKAGKTVTPGAADAALTTGTVVRGTARRASGGAVPSGFVTAYEAATGDFAGTGWLNNGTYEMRVFGPTLVRFNVDDGAGINGWHREAEDFAHAAAVFIPSSGTTTIDVVVS